MSSYNNYYFTLAFPTGAGIRTYTIFSVVIPDGFYTITYLNAFILQFCITNWLYLIVESGDNVYYIGFYVNQTSYAIQLLLYIVPRWLPTGYTAPSNWIGFSTYTADRTPHIHIPPASKFNESIGFNSGQYPPNITSIK